MVLLRGLAAGWLICSVAAPGSVALADDERGVVDPDSKRVTAVRVDTPPVLDGRLDEPVWQLADVIRDFYDREPVAGGTPSQRTEAYLLYDDDYLYVGFVLWDDDPASVVATQLRRDDRMRTDDTMAILIDTFHDHRNAFVFRVNALGNKYDATLTNETEINSDWDEVWEASASITERGWEAELAIPFRVLRYPTGGIRTWGVDFKREIRRTNEEVNWSNFSQDHLFNAVHLAGHLEGLGGLKVRGRFRLKPYATGSHESLALVADPTGGPDGALGIEDFKVLITPNLTGDLTVNTDFAQVEVDDTRVNLTRFPLFFPEKREFFLEGANNFSFSDLTRFGSPEPAQVVLYHSRRIGLEGGVPVPIGYGAKVTGKLGGGTLGALNVQTLDADGTEGQNFSVLRWRQDVLQRSYVGAIATNVQGGGAFNRVGGIDAGFNLFEYLNVSAFAAAASDSEVDGLRWTGQLATAWVTDKWEASASALLVDDDFDSDVGFILRRNIVKQSYSAGWKPRPDWKAVRQVSVFGGLQYITDRHGRLLDRTPWTAVETRFESGDILTVEYLRRFERLDEAFEIYPGIVVPGGDYSYQEGALVFRGYDGRPVSGTAIASYGSFYDGTRLSLAIAPLILFSEKLSVAPTYSFNHIELSGGAFDTHVARLRVNYSFSDQLLSDALLQYNSVSGLGSVFARLRYIYRIGDDIYLVFRQTRAWMGAWEGEMDRTVTLKATYSFNF